MTVRYPLHHSPYTLIHTVFIFFSLSCCIYWTKRLWHPFKMSTPHSHGHYSVSMWPSLTRLLVVPDISRSTHPPDITQGCRAGELIVDTIKQNGQDIILITYFLFPTTLLWKIIQFNVIGLLCIFCK